MFLHFSILFDTITLIGFAGCGKTTIAPLLAQRLNYQWMDSDHWIENSTGKTISAIFEHEGESYFREWEYRWLQTISDSTSTVYSVGGGLPCQNGYMEYLKAYSWVIYLKTDFPTLYSRLSEAKESRPLVKRLSYLELYHLFEQRLVYYEQADWHINAQLPILEIVEKIVLAVSTG